MVSISLCASLFFWSFNSTKTFHSFKYAAYGGIILTYSLMPLGFCIFGVFLLCSPRINACTPTAQKKVILNGYQQSASDFNASSQPCKDHDVITVEITPQEISVMFSVSCGQICS